MYQILPFRFARFNDSEYLLTNDVGEYIFLSNEDFEKFINMELDTKSTVFQDIAQVLPFPWNDAILHPAPAPPRVQRIFPSLHEGRQYERRLPLCHTGADFYSELACLLVVKQIRKVALP